LLSSASSEYIRESLNGRCDQERLTDALRTLLGLYFVPTETQGERARQVAMFVVDLGEFSDDAVWWAIREWRRTQDRKPTPASLRQLCMMRREEASKHHKSADDDWLEQGILKRVRHWLDGSPGEGEKGIPGHLVTMERLKALGLSHHEARRALGFGADPYNHGIDKKLSHEDRLEYARRQRAADAALLARGHEVPDTTTAAQPLKHWSKAAAPNDPRWAQVRAARAKSLLINANSPGAE
jgi:hypothetical protein